MEKDFLKYNQEFWSVFPAKESGKKILVGETVSPMIVHVTSVFSVILNQARSLKPVWLHEKGEDIELLRSYVSTADFISIPNRALLDKIKIFFIAFQKFMIIRITKDVLSFSYQGVKYGDIVYDAYLSEEKVGTIRHIGLKILRIIYTCICRHEDIRRILKSDNFEGVLVSHQIGISAGIMLRTALRYGYKGYFRAGHHLSTLQRFERLEEVYDYEFKPSPSVIDKILAKYGHDIEKQYLDVLDKQVSGKISADSKHAFSAKNKYYTDRQLFGRDFGLDVDKKNVFVMLHAFNDSPHSHFRWMIFKDYYDWFMETLKFAKKNNKVNWIFKQHPSIKFYPIKDVSFDSLFSGVKSNVIYIGEEKQIDTRSLVSCADLVITCIGSAGFELPAMAAIPSIAASDNFYTDLGFVLEPKTRKEYFEILGRAQNIERLSSKQQEKARAAYIYIYQLSRVSISACPIVDFEEEKDPGINIWYWKKVSELYETRGNVIKNEISDYIAKVAKPGFKRLNGFGYE
jgi:hypothetical protein